MHYPIDLDITMKIHMLEERKETYSHTGGMGQTMRESQSLEFPYTSKVAVSSLS